MVWDGIAVICGDNVQAVNVATRPQRPIRLGYHVKWRGPEAVGMLYYAQTLYGGELLLSHSQFYRVKVSCTRKMECGNDMLNTLITNRGGIGRCIQQWKIYQRC